VWKALTFVIKNFPIGCEQQAGKRNVRFLWHLNEDYASRLAFMNLFLLQEEKQFQRNQSLLPFHTATTLDR